MSGWVPNYTFLENPPPGYINFFGKSFTRDYYPNSLYNRDMKINVEANANFQDAHSSTHRYRVYWGSAGSGKSVDIAQGMILRLMEDRGRNLLCIRKAEITNRDSTFSELQKAIYNLGLDNYWKATSTPMMIRCVNGNRIIFRGMKDENEKEKIKSITVPRGTLTDIWVEEATELTPEDFEILDDRLRGILPDDLFYQITMSFNPVSATHWIKKRFFDYVDEQVYTIHSTYLTNRFIDEGYHARMARRRDLDPEGYRIYGLGQWGELRGLIFKNWEVKNVSLDISQYDDIAVGQDFGYNHANCLLLLGIKDDDIYILKEIYVHELHTGEIIDISNKAFMPRDVDMWCDSAEPDRIKEWSEAGYNARGVKKEKNSVTSQIDWLKQRQIYIHPSCNNTIKEIQQYKWKYDSTNDVELDQPVNIYDDAMAALRYGIETWRKHTAIVIMDKYQGGI